MAKGEWRQLAKEAPISTRTTSARPRRARRRARRQAEAYCPHCFLLVESAVEGDWPPSPERCPHCRLMIGPGRARPTPEANPGARGTAAGVFAHRAKHTAGDVDSSPDEVRKAIRQVAAELGARPERLLMVDYQQRAAIDDELPDLDDVFAAFGSWKQARRAAATG